MSVINKIKIDTNEYDIGADYSNITSTPDLSGFITKEVNDLTYYTLATNTGSTIELSINSSTYVMTMNLKNSAGTTISTGTVDLPLESVVVSGSYDNTSKKIILTLQSGSTIDVPVGDLVSGLQPEITSSNKLSADLIDDTNTTNKLTNATEKSTWNAKYDLPSGGIPSTDLSSAVQTSLGKADTAIQDISGKQDTLVSGTNIKTINNTSILGSGNIDTEVIQYSTMPTASSSTVGKIVQFTGTTDSTYTNGYFYIGTEDNGAYSWEAKNVQDGGGSSTPHVFIWTYGDSTYLAQNMATAQSWYNEYSSTQITPEAYLKYSYDSTYGFDKVVNISTETGTSNRYTLHTDIQADGNYHAYREISFYVDNTGTVTDFVKGTNKSVSVAFAYTSSNTGVPYQTLTTNNDYSYTPTSNYHPATKKYVDDSIASAITTTLGGSY